MKSSFRHKWSTEEKEYLAEIVPGRHYKEISELMEDRFDMEYTTDQIKSAISRYKLNTGFKGHFKKGQKAFNKGKKAEEYMSKEAIEKSKKTQFKKGTIPPNHRPVGSERINIDGYYEIKVAEPKKWRLKHNVLWEKYNNKKIPKGYVVTFANKDKTDMSKDNLILISRTELLTMNKYKLIQEEAELTKVGVVVAKVIIKTGQRKKELKEE